MEGCIRRDRKFQEHWIWKRNEPFDKRSAWLDRLLRANYKDTIINFEGKEIEVKKGSFITSEIKLSNKWKWSRKKVRTFLETLERDNMLTKESTTKYTTISIENWDLYQFKEQQKEHQKNNKRDTDKQYNNIYLYLFNIYKAKILEEPRKTIQIISELQNSENYNSLTLEEQDKLFEDLMNPQKRELL